MEEQQTMNNHILLCGEMDSMPAFSHENHGRRFCRFMLTVRRLSGTADRIPVLADWDQLEEADVCPGERIAVEGQIRSYNQKSEDGRHLIVSVYASVLESSAEAHDNQVSLTGRLCRDPIFRCTPLGREICDAMLAVSRPYRRSDYIPCIFWGRTAREIARLSAGAEVALTGRLQSRDYNKRLEDGSLLQRTAYEVSAISAEPLVYD